MSKFPAECSACEAGRAFVHRHPYLIAAGAAMLGYAVANLRPRRTYCHAEDLAELAQQQPLHVEVPRSRRRPFSALVGGAAASLIEGAMALTGRQLGTIASQILSEKAHDCITRQERQRATSRAIEHTQGGREALSAECSNRPASSET